MQSNAVWIPGDICSGVNWVSHALSWRLRTDTPTINHMMQNQRKEIPYSYIFHKKNSASAIHLVMLCLGLSHKDRISGLALRPKAMALTLMCLV